QRLVARLRVVPPDLEPDLHQAPVPSPASSLPASAVLDARGATTFNGVPKPERLTVACSATAAPAPWTFRLETLTARRRIRCWPSIQTSNGTVDNPTCFTAAWNDDCCAGGRAAVNAVMLIVPA